MAGFCHLDCFSIPCVTIVNIKKMTFFIYSKTISMIKFLYLSNSINKHENRNSKIF